MNNGYCLTLLTDFYERANWRQFQTLHSSEIVLGIHEFFGLSNVWAELVSSEVPMPNRCHGCFQAWPTVMVCVINSALANSLGGFQYHMLPWVRTQEVCVGGWRRSRNAADFSNDFRVKWRQSSQQQKGTSGGLSSVVAFCVRGFGPLIRWHFRHSAERVKRVEKNRLMQKTRRSCFCISITRLAGQFIFKAGIDVTFRNWIIFSKCLVIDSGTSWISLTSQWFSTALGNTRPFLRCQKSFCLSISLPQQQQKLASEMLPGRSTVVSRMNECSWCQGPSQDTHDSQTLDGEEELVSDQQQPRRRRGRRKPPLSLYQTIGYPKFKEGNSDSEIGNKP